jgi:hypothetical protein
VWILVFLLAAGVALFIDHSAKSGVTAKLENGAAGNKRLIETMTGGVALLDFDGDGLLDIYLVNGAELPSFKKTSAKYWNRLYRNRGGWRFEDVTARAVVAGSGYDMGAAVADYDNDGHPDLFVTGVRGNTLFRNRGDGTFEDVTTKAGLAGDTKWAVGAGWFDMDNDGDLDLFVVRYVDWDPAKEPVCGEPRAYCHPKHYAPLANLLYRNEGDGQFRDVSAESGIAAHPGKGMAVAFGDANQDHLLDIFVTNDTEPNFLFLNVGGGKFRESGGPAGVAFNGDGRALSSMGADFRDWDNDGREDLYLTALTNETFPLFRGLGEGRFLDRTYLSLVGRATLGHAGWSAGIQDFDNDGWKDLFAACADVQDNTAAFSGRASRQQNLLLINQKGRTFARVDIEAAPPAMHRGAAFGDLDGDGAIDAVVSRLGESPLLLRNAWGRGNHWITLRLRGTKSNRDGLGARVELRTARGKQWNRASTAMGYASSSSQLVHFGLGEERAIEEVIIRWPSGVEQKIANPQVDRYLDVVEP